jgi:hypothetical protein
MMTIRLQQHSVVVLAISLTVLSIALSGSAFAQMQPKRDVPKDKPVDLKSEAYRKQIDEQYQSTLKAIPDQPQKKVDPWGNVRSSPK